MFARIVRMNLKANSEAEFNRTLENEIIPLLRRQKGFRDEIAFVVPDGREAVAISLWDRKESAENYHRSSYPEVLQTLGKVIEGSPQIQNCEVCNSTFHKITARVAA